MDSETCTRATLPDNWEEHLVVHVECESGEESDGEAEALPATLTSRAALDII